jgi:hypothetical protein
MLSLFTNKPDLRTNRRSRRTHRPARPSARLEGLEDRTLLTIGIIGINAFHAFAGARVALNPVAEFYAIYDGFYDTNPADFSVSINWGDGSALDTTSARLTTVGNAILAKGSHTYLTPNTSYPVTVTVCGLGDSVTQQSQVVPVTLLPDPASRPPDVPKTYPGAQPLGDDTLYFEALNGFFAYAGVGFSLNPVASVIGTYNGSNDNTASDYRAQVNWGDSTHWDPNVRLVANGNSILVKGSHTYAAQGTYDVTVDVTGPDGQTAAQRTIPVIVSLLPDPASRPPDEPMTYPGAQPLGAETLYFEAFNGFFAHAGVGFSLNPVASIIGTYNGSNDNTASDYRAQVNWGDSAHWDPNVCLVANGNSMLVKGSHTYAAQGNYDVTVDVTGPDGQTATQKTILVVVGPNSNPVATKLVVTSLPPVNENLGGTFGLAVSAEDDAGHVITDYTGNVTIALNNNPSGAVLGGQTTVTPHLGVATFSGLTLNQLALGDTFVISSPGLTSATATMGVIRPPGDYLFAGKTEPAVFRRTTPSLLQWFVRGLQSQSGRLFGAVTQDVPLTGDFDGDKKIDLAIYRPGTAQWFVTLSGSNYTCKLLTTFGQPNVDIPEPGYYTSNTKTVPAVYRPTTGQWFIAGHSGAITFTTFKTGDIPVPGDYDNTGLDELAIYRPSTGQWIINGPRGVHSVSFGGPQDLPVPGAYNASATNHSVEPAVWRRSTGQFFIKTPSGPRTLQFASGDIPIAGDFDGIGVTEAAVYRPARGQWFVAGPHATAPRFFASFGGTAGVPTGAPYEYRSLRSGGGGGAIHVDNLGPAQSVDIRATAPGVAQGSSLATANPGRAAVRLRPTQDVIKHFR